MQRPMADEPLSDGESPDVYSPDDSSAITAARLLAYEEVCAAGSVLLPGSPDETPSFDDLSPGLACVDLLHRVWPGLDFTGQTTQDHLTTVTLGDFRLIREIGRGGMGVVYEAEQLSLRRHVALKIFPNAQFASEKLLTRFKNEIRTAASFDHPHIAAVMASGDDRGVHFYAMQLVRGHSLAQIVDARRAQPAPAATCESQSKPGGAMPHADVDLGWTNDWIHNRKRYFRHVAELGIQACDALQYAHERGVVHRDIKPSNLLVNSERCLWVTDFGLALVQGDAALTATGDMLGTLRYMSPEQAHGDARVVDRRADVYSLGATLYELITLRPPLEGSDPRELLRQVADDQPRRPRRGDPSVPFDLELILLKALEKNAASRYESAKHFGDDLRRFAASRPVLARQPSRIEYAWRFVRRYPVVFGLLFAVLLLVFATAVIATVGFVRTRIALRDKSAALVELRAEQAAGYQNLYVAELRSAHERLMAGASDELQQLLEQHLPQPGRQDLRGWEWYYLLTCVRRELAIASDVGNCVKCVAWCPDGTRFAAAGDLGIFVADSANGQKLWLDRHNCQSVCWKPDGSLIACGNSTSPFTVSIRDPSTGRQLSELVGHRGPVSSVAWSPDGKYVAAGAFGGGCIVWDSSTGNQLRTLGSAGSRNQWETIWREPVAARESVFVAWSLDSSRVTTAGSGQLVQIWELATGRALEKRDIPPGAVTGMSTSSNGQWIAVCVGNPPAPCTILIANANTGETKRVLQQPGEVLSVAFSPDGRRLAVGSRSQRSQILDLETGQPVSRVEKYVCSPFAVSYASDGRLATGCADGSVLIWDPSRPYDVTQLNNHAWCGPLIFAPDGQRFACGLEGEEVAVCDLVTGEDKVRFEGRNADLRHPAWSADGHWLAWADTATAAFKLVNANTGLVHWTANHDAQVSVLEFSPDGRMLVTASTASGNVSIWDVASGRSLQILPADRTGIASVAWRPDGKQLVTVGSEANMKVWRVGDWTLSSSISTGSYGWTESVVWRPDGRQIIAGSSDQRITAWDAKSDSLDVGAVRPRGTSPVARVAGRQPAGVRRIGRQHYILESGPDP